MVVGARLCCSVTKLPKYNIRTNQHSYLHVFIIVIPVISGPYRHIYHCQDILGRGKLLIQSQASCIIFRLTRWMPLPVLLGYIYSANWYENPSIAVGSVCVWTSGVWTFYPIHFMIIRCLPSCAIPSFEVHLWYTPTIIPHHHGCEWLAI